MGEEKEKIQQTDNGQEKEIKVKREDIIYALLCGVVVGLILMGAATIVNGWWAYFLNVISSGGYLVVAICLMLLTFYQNLFCKQKVEKNKLPAKIVATLIYYAIAVLFIFVSWEGLLNKDFSDLTFWLVAISWVLVSVLIIVKQISINKQDFENSPLQSYAYILCGMLYAFAYAVILKFNFDVALKIFYTIHTVVALTVFINIIFRYGIKASNFLQLALFIVSVIMLMALLVSTLYFWFWNFDDHDLFTSIMGVFAGLIGGVLTLTGVAWTIKRQDEIRKEDERKKHIPYFAKFFKDGSEKGRTVTFSIQQSKDIKCVLNNYVSVDRYKELDKNKLYVQFTDFYIYLINIEMCKLLRLELNGNELQFDERAIVTNNNVIYLQTSNIYEVNNIESIKLIAEDDLGYQYSYNIRFKRHDDYKFIVHDEDSKVLDDIEYKKIKYTRIEMQEIELPILLNK